MHNVPIPSMVVSLCGVWVNVKRSYKEFVKLSQGNLYSCFWLVTTLVVLSCYILASMMCTP